MGLGNPSDNTAKRVAPLLIGPVGSNPTRSQVIDWLFGQEEVDILSTRDAITGGEWSRENDPKCLREYADVPIRVKIEATSKEFGHQAMIQKYRAYVTEDCPCYKADRYTPTAKFLFRTGQQVELTARDLENAEFELHEKRRASWEGLWSEH